MGGQRVFEVTRSQFTGNPAGRWETAENLLSRTIKMNMNAQITAPHGYNTANATLYLQAVITTKFVTLGPDTYKEGFDSQGNPTPALNSPDEGDTGVSLTYNLLRLGYEWTTDITHQLDFEPSFEAWYPRYYCPVCGPCFFSESRHSLECCQRTQHGDIRPHTNRRSRQAELWSLCT